MKKTVVLFLFVLLMLCSGCESEPVSATEILMDTVCTITLYSPADPELAREGLALAAQYEKQFSSTAEGGDVWRINHSKGQSVEVSRETAELLETALTYCELSAGRFDVTMGCLVDLWDIGGENHVPEAAELAAALATVNYENLVLDGSTVCLLNPAARLELGAVAKGYIASLVADWLRQQGVTRALLDFGGNIVVIGEKPDGSPWRIGIQQPFSGQGEIAGLVEMKEGAAVTSGVYQRYFESSGVRYHHVLDPQTGYPVETDLLGVTVIGSDSGQADAMSTLCLLLGEEDGAALLEAMDWAQGAVWIYENRISVTGNVNFTAQD